MKLIRIPTIALSACLLIIAGSVLAHGNEQNHANVSKQLINESYANFTRLLKEGKPQELAQTLYTENAQFFPPQGGMVEGREAIGNVFSKLIDAGLVIEPVAEQVESYGHHAYEYGIATTFSKEGAPLSKERYVVIWKLEDGRWRIHRDFVKGRPLE